ncbi:MAG: hypothetical protein JXR03_13115 [Cyclobacteriaceae bacterium]
MPESSKYKLTLATELIFNDNKIELGYETIVGDNKPKKPEDQVLYARLVNQTLGGLIEGVVRIFRSSFRLNLPFPWGKLFEVKFDSLELNYWPASKAIGFTVKNINVDLGIIRIDEVTVRGKSAKQVDVILKGNFFGNDEVKWNAADAQGPPLPPKKTPGFDLKFLGLGQHVSLTNAKDFNHVKDAIAAMSAGMDTPPEGTVVPVFQNMKFDENSNWLFGIDAEILPPTVAFQIVFNDPSLYGLYIKLGGEKAKALAGLEFEIIYKKITEDIGVYQSEIKLPFYLRNLEFGAMSITLPKIGIEIYTNGNFRINLGFPYNMDFRDSFVIQYFPFLGAGGFYFASLTGATSKTVPKTDQGYFDPVIEFGIGLELGWGKRIDKGILSAAISLTVFGIIEGTFADFKRIERRPEGDVLVPVQTEKALFYHLRGTFGIIGRIWGKVDFAIISATFDITVFIYVAIDFMAAEPLYLKFVAGIRVRITVRINCGLFTIKIHFSFKMTVRASFTLGSSEPAPWKPILTQSDFDPNTIPILTDEEKWQTIAIDWTNRLVSTEETKKIDLYLFPQFSVAQKGDIQDVMGVAMFFVRNKVGDKQALDLDSAVAFNSGLFAFEKICIKLLSWALNASQPLGTRKIGFEEFIDKEITLTDLYNIYYTLKDEASPIAYEEITAFLADNFSINILESDSLNAQFEAEEKPESAEGETTEETSEPKRRELSLAVFPAIPELTLTTSLNGKDQTRVRFQDHNVCRPDFLSNVRKDRQKYSQSEDVNNYNTSDHGSSVSQLVFNDYFFVLIKNLLQSSIDAMEIYRFKIPETIVPIPGTASVTMAVPTTIESIAEDHKITPLSIVKANKSSSEILKAGSKIIVSGIEHQATSLDTLKKLQTKYELSDGQVATLLSINKEKVVLKPGFIIDPQTINYQVQEKESLEVVSQNTGKSYEELSTLLMEEEGAINSFVSLTIPDIEHVIKAEDSFLSIAKDFNSSLLSLSEANLKNDSLLAGGSYLILENLPKIKIEDLLNYLYLNGDLEQASGLLSRIFWNGQRLPVEGLASVDTTEKDEALYTLTGQSFKLPKVDPEEPYDFTLALTQEQDNNWINFIDTEPPIKEGALIHKLDSTEVNKIKSLREVTFAPTYQEAKRATFFELQPRKFPLVNAIEVRHIEEDAALQKVIQFSKPLLDFVSDQENASKGLRLFKTIEDRPDTVNEEKDITSDDYSWGLLLNTYIKKVSDSDAGAVGQNTYELFGTDSGGMISLTNLIRDLSNNPIASISVLFRPQESDEKGYQGYLPDSVTNILINTNLSTESNPEDIIFQFSQGKPKDTDPNDFVKRLWKASVVRTGGYYLYYNTVEGDTGLPDDIFDDGGSAELGILISFKKKEEVKGYTNCAIISENLDLDVELLSAVPQTKEGENWRDIEEKGLTIKPGFEGFELEREKPIDEENVDSEKVGAFNAKYETEQQYNLLAYDVPSDDHIDGLGKGEALSPSKDDELDRKGANEDNRLDGEENSWDYKKVIPLKNIFIPQKNGSEAIPAINSPYIGLNQDVKFTFEWRDNFGFEYDRPINPIGYKVLYRDKLIGLNQWPGLESTYYFKGHNSEINNFKIDFIFDAKKRYEINPELSESELEKEIQKIKEKALGDLENYGLIYYQLAETLALNLEVSMMPRPEDTFDLSASLKGDLEDLIQVIYKDIMDAYKDPVAFQSKSVTVKKTDLTLTVKDRHEDNIYPLKVTLTARRPEELIEPEFKNELNVAFTKSIIRPLNTTIDDEDLSPTETQLYSYRKFATGFENAFQNEGLKLTLSYTHSLLSEKGQLERDSEIWVVRFSQTDNKGIDYNIDYENPLFYAPQPLANHLLLLENQQLFSYESGVGLNEAQTLSKTFSDVDPEQWARIFLEDFEDYLKPDYTISMTILDQADANNEFLNRLLEAKRKLATAISYQTIPIFDQGDYDEKAITVAREKLKQQLLINLLDGYSLDTVVQYPVEIKSDTKVDKQHLPPNLYGKTINRDEKPETEDGSNGTHSQKDYALSTGKVALENGKSYLTFTFNTLKEALHSNVPLKLEYKISHLEHDIQNAQELSPGDDALKDFTLSKWLSFIIPIEKKENPIVTKIPVPIRSYPNLPNLGKQQVVTQNKAKISAKDIVKIKQYQYQFDYQADFVAQDLLNFEVVFNAKGEEHKLLSDLKPIDSLDTQMAQYISARSGFKQDMDTLLRDKGDENVTKATNVVESFIRLMSQISQAWYDRYKPDNLETSAKDDIKSIIAKFSIDEEALDSSLEDNDPKNHYVLFLENWEVDGPGVSVPKVVIPGYKTYLRKIESGTPENPKVKFQMKFYELIGRKRKYLNFQEGLELKKRTITFENLDVLSVQNGWAGVRIIRNTELIEDSPLTTRQEFVYRTPLIRYTNAVTPHMVNFSSINYLDLTKTGKKADIETQLTRLVSYLFTETPAEIVNTLLAKLQISYAYIPAGQSSTFPQEIRLPEFLTTSIEFYRPDSGIPQSQMVKDLAETLQKWLVENERSLVFNRSKFYFDVTCFSLLADGDLPILRLKNLYINESDIIWK